METEFSPRILHDSSTCGVSPCPVGNDAYACKSCGAIIAEQDLHKHTDWHERLRRAVDETETIG